MTRRVGFLTALLASTALAQTVPSYQQLAYPPLKQVKIPEPATFTLKNGMRVFLLEDHELPLISGLALIRTGNLFDPKDKVGLAQITVEEVNALGNAAINQANGKEDVSRPPSPMRRRSTAACWSVRIRATRTFRPHPKPDDSSRTDLGCACGTITGYSVDSLTSKFCWRASWNAAAPSSYFVFRY